MEDLQVHYDMVEATIRSFGVDPAICRGDKPGKWNMKKGSADVWIDIWHVENEKRGYFQVMAPVMAVPTTNTEAFYKELLTLNDQMYGVAFSIFNNWSYIKVTREVDSLNQNEVTATLNRVGIYSDDYDDMLKQKYASIVPSAPNTPPA